MYFAFYMTHFHLIGTYTTPLYTVNTSFLDVTFEVVLVSFFEGAEWMLADPPWPDLASAKEKVAKENDFQRQTWTEGTYGTGIFFSFQTYLHEVGKSHIFLLEDLDIRTGFWVPKKLLFDQVLQINALVV